MLAAWKANSRNAKLLEEFFRIKGEENMANGLPNLTPHVDERGRKIDHPAQPVARDVATSGPAPTAEHGADDATVVGTGAGSSKPTKRSNAARS